MAVPERMTYLLNANILTQLNNETQKHSMRVADICSFIAPKIGLDVSIASKIGLFHDIGKMYIPSNIVKKNKKLTGLEREIIDLHAYYGYKMLKEAGEPSMIYLPVLFHHGYWKPKINVYEEEYMDEYTVKYVHLLHSADVYDAMTSRRVYHEPFNAEQALEALTNDMLSNPVIIEHLRGYAPLEKADIIEFDRVLAQAK